ncbi:hypothetical protein WA026_011565 [Henosepilachna vigintioctopunctata]|uniref:Thioredoxin domain-containing protein n=1 Tax=Henosepilachna vigintioctopunctata TaxID=420089 RepID=A0AAW1TT13_9CUCU
MKSIYLLSFLLFNLFTGSSCSLEVVKDDELVDLIKSENYLVVLFTLKHCEECDNFENELIGLREVLVEELDAWVVKAENSQMTRLYSPSKEPILVFFRHGIPLLYDGPINEELILHTFSFNKEPISKELTDETFEHLTQAATGATTGDWFVMFYTSDCVDCQRMQARWEAVGAKIKSRTNIARLNRATTGAATARRFDVYHVPAFVLFRQGKMYKYQIQKYDIDSLVSFAQDWYRNVQGERVPPQKTPFDDLISLIAVYLKDYPWLWQVGLAIFVIIILDILRRIIFSNR